MTLAVSVAPGTIVLAVLLWVALLIIIAMFLKGAAAKPTPAYEPPPPPPREPSVQVIARLMGQLVKEAVVETNAATAKAIGEAVAAAIAPSPAAIDNERLNRVQHELNNLAAELDVDDSDPFDHIIPRDRQDAVFASRDDTAPFGVPGQGFPAVEG